MVMSRLDPPSTGFSTTGTSISGSHSATWAGRWKSSMIIQSGVDRPIRLTTCLVAALSIASWLARGPEPV